MKRLLFSILVLILVLSVTSVQAQIPRVMNYQGMLLGSNGQPVPDGNYNLTFKLYDDTNNLLWTEVHNQVSIGGGLFQIILGTVTPLNIPFDKPYFLGIQVGSDPELQPRMMLTSAAYAIRADDSNQLLGYKISPTPEPNKILPLDASGKFPASVISGGDVSGDFIKKSVPDTSRGTSISPLILVSNLGNGDGIDGRSTNGVGMAGRSTANDGVSGWTDASGKSGVFGSSTDGRGVVGRSDNDDGVVGWTGAAEKSGVFGHSTNGNGITGQSENKNGVYGTTTVNSQEYAGVSGYSQDGIAVLGKSKNNNGVVGWTGVSQHGAYCGVYGYSTNGTGVRGRSENYIALQGTNKSDTYTTLSVGNEGAAAAIYAQAGTGKIAAVFRGNVQVQSLITQAPIIELGEGLDYAEGFDLSNNTEITPGTVLIIDPDNPGKLTISNIPYDQKVAGIVAGAKGLGSGVRLGCDQFDKNVALAGRVYCNVDASNEEVQPGDLLTTSTTPGYAMAAKDYSKAQGAILGKAMESLPKGKKGQILVLVSLQ